MIVRIQKAFSSFAGVDAPVFTQAGPIMLKSGIDVTEIITAIGDYTESVNSTKTLVQPVVKLYEQSPVIEHADEVCTLQSRSAHAQSFPRASSSTPHSLL